MRNFLLPNNYQAIVKALKEKIREVRRQASLKLNSDLLSIYNQIGSAIAEQESQSGWGAKVIERLSRDLKAEFEGMRGLSPRNLRYMRDFALAYPEFPFLQGGLAKIEGQSEPGNTGSILQGELAKLTWYHHITLLDKVKDANIRGFYIRETIRNGWTRNVLVHQIEGGLHEAKGQLTHNFDATTTHPGLISQVFKDPYVFDFIFLGREAKERDLENAMTAQLTKVLLELGQYFAFLGKQQRLVLKENEYFIDLLFYHTKLKRYIIIELKIGEFHPEYIGQMGFYLSLAQHFRVGEEPCFTYRLSGFKKAGVETFDVFAQISIPFYEYHYGIKLLNYNNNQAFIKKLYDQALTDEELRIVGEVVSKAIFDQIEWQINRISGPNEQAELG